jgi:XTP/dITP diphosphohydrolase
MNLLVATRNAGKISELKELLKNLPVSLQGLKDFPHIEEVAETGWTFAENASLKASAYALRSGLWALSDDSGLEVKALQGAPGVFSARYGGEKSSDEARIYKLLDELNATDDKLRQARFVCVMAIANEKGDIVFTAEGVCNGTIAEKPRGNNGFGYDPIFIPEGFDKTFGELSADIKSQISHRAKAIRKIIRFLSDIAVA